MLFFLLTNANSRNNSPCISKRIDHAFYYNNVNFNLLLVGGFR